MSKFTFLFAYVQSALATQKRDEEGATATEYALLVTGICLVLLGGVAFFGGQLNTFFRGLGTSVGIAP